MTRASGEEPDRLETKAFEQAIEEALRDAGTAAAEGRVEEACEIVRGLAELALDVGSAEDALHLVDGLITAVPETQIASESRAWLHHVKGRAFAALGRKEDATIAFEEMRRLGEAASDLAAVSVADLNLGNQAHSRKDYPEAKRRYGASLQSSLSRNDGEGSYSALLNMTQLARETGEIDRAEEFLSYAEEMAQRVREPDVRFGLAFQRAGQAAARQQFEEAARHYQYALRAARRWQDPNAEARALQNLGSTAMDMGRPLYALRWYRKSLALAQELGLPPLLYDQHRVMAVASYRAGRYAAAAEHFGKARDYAALLGDRPGWAGATADTGAVLLRLNETEQSASRLEEALTAFEEIGDDAWQARTLGNLFEAYRVAGDMQKAAAYGERALSLMPPEAHAERGAFLRRLAEGWLFVGREPTRAAERFEKAVSEEMEGKPPEEVAWCYSITGATLLQGGAPREALPFFDRGLRIYEDTGDEHLAFQTRNDRANALAELGRYEVAWSGFETCLSVALRLEDRAMEFQARSNLGELARRMGRREEALALLQKAVDLAESLGDEEERGSALVGLALALNDVERHPEARPLFEQAREIARRMRDTATEALAVRGLAVLEMRAGRAGAARRLLQRAERLFSRTGDERHVAETIAHLVETAATLGRADEMDTEGQRLLDLVARIQEPDIAAWAFVGAGRWWLLHGEPQIVAELFGTAILMGALDSVRDEEQRAQDQAVLLAVAMEAVYGNVATEDQGAFWNQVISFLNERYDGSGEDLRPYLEEMWKLFLGQIQEQITLE